VHGEEPKVIKSESGDHEMQNMYCLGKIDEHQELRCAKGKCKDSRIRQTEKKTGFLRCPESSSNADMCTQCSPKPQVNRKASYTIQHIGSSVYRLPRANCVLIDSKPLTGLSSNQRVLAALRQCNVVITKRMTQEEFGKLLDDLKKKAKDEPYWQPCLETQILQVSAGVFRSMEKFLMGMPAQSNAGERSTMLSHLYQEFDFVQEKILSKEKSLDFVQKFMKLPIADASIANNKE